MTFSRLRCVDTKPRKVAAVAPKTKAQRTRLLQRFGARSFLFPLGTPASPGKPSFPVADKGGCFSCSLARAAHSRLRQGINRPGNPPSYRHALVTEDKNLIQMTLKHADERDRKNACNWAIPAAKRYL